MNVDQAYSSSEDTDVMMASNPTLLPQIRGQSTIPVLVSAPPQPPQPEQPEQKQQHVTRLVKMQEIDQQQISSQERENKKLLLELDYQQQINEGLREWIHDLHKKIESLLPN